MNNESEMEEKRREEELGAGGWEAITQAFEKRYPEQTNPLHFGTLISWRLGGQDPLDGISVYDGGDFWHFVTYGFSELWDKESENTEYSGYGFELTVKLKKRTAVGEAGGSGQDAGTEGTAYDPAADGDIRGMAGVLQALARYSFDDGVVFQPYEYIYTGQESGMDPEGVSKITGFITVPDEAGKIDTPNGRLEFVLLVGVTDRELKAIIDGQITVRQAAEKLEDTVTDYGRAEILQPLSMEGKEYGF